MKHNNWNKINTVILFTISILLSWIGMIYATSSPYQLKMAGIAVALIGYIVLLLAFHGFDSSW